jgi:hypothetical protein
MIVAPFSAKDAVERRDEWAPMIADQETDPACVPDGEVAGGLGRPIAGRVTSDTSKVERGACRAR